MKKAKDDIKSFITVSMIILLYLLLLGFLVITKDIPEALLTLFIASFSSVIAWFFNKDQKRETNETTNTNETK
jgi:hypothetical protein